MRICAWPCGQAQTPLLLRPSYDEERRRSRRTEGRPLSLSVQFSTARNVQFSAGVDTHQAIVSKGFLNWPAQFRAFSVQVGRNGEVPYALSTDSICCAPCRFDKAS